MPRIPEGTPVICRQCGGNMTLQNDLVAVCRYCGARDTLPHDELGRALDIKNRLAAAEQRVAQLRGVDAALASIFEDPKAFLRVSGLYFAFAVLLLGASLSQLFSSVLPNVSRLPLGVILSLLAGQLIGPLSILGFAFSFAIALAHGRSHYRKTLRPLLLARAGRDHVTFACRACGGDLPPAQRADVRCPYCNTLNLIPKELHGAHAAALFQMAESTRQQLRGINVTTISIASRMRRALLISGVLAVALIFGLQALAQKLATVLG
jgi:DNA-directed RNA polymerase subunit RPC12/RpoP